jgi:hypothetical protein
MMQPTIQRSSILFRSEEKWPDSRVGDCSQGWSIWFTEYKNNADYEKRIMASNLISGWMQRLDGTGTRKVPLARLVLPDKFLVWTLDFGVPGWWSRRGSRN